MHDIRTRFLSHTRTSPNGCYEWTSERLKSGYGRFSLRGKTYSAHRVALHLFEGFDLASKLYVCHHCDNPGCVNPAHLFAGTATDNMRDSARKGRRPNFKGVRHPQAKLSLRDCYEIRELKLAGVSNRIIQKRFNISLGPIYQIIYRQHWSMKCS